MLKSNEKSVCCLQVYFSIVSVVKFVFGFRSSTMLISSGQQPCQNVPEINLQQSWKNSNLTVEVKQHLADWQEQR